MRIETTRFGTLEVEEDRIIHVPEGLIGFPGDRRYVLLEHRKDSPFLWFQSLDHGTLAFVVTDPLLIMPDYEIDLNPEDMALLNLEGKEEELEEIRPMAIVNISKGNQKEVTVNLLGPIIIYHPKKLAKQVILYHSAYSHRHPMLLNPNEKAP